MANFMTGSFLGIELWVAITVLAALTQTLRSAVQKKMKPELGDMGATYIRFSYALPFAWLWVLGYGASLELNLPYFTSTFWFWVSFAGLMQVFFTIFLIKVFSHRSFAAGTAFSKTEVLQAALFEALLLGYVVSIFSGAAIIIGVIAVIMLSLAKARSTGDTLRGILVSRQTIYGLLSGATLGLATVSFKVAVISIDTPNGFYAAGLTGAVAVTLQTIVMGLWMAMTSYRGEFMASLRHWRQSSLAGLFGAISTAAWFSAFALHHVASVRAVGQVELLITIGVSVLYFKEKLNKIETVAIMLLLTSIIMILMD